jgi:hypothetical protein
MATVGALPTERRRARRIRPEHGPWKAEAVLRPGVPVKIIDLAPHGVRVASHARLRPGRRAEIQFTAHDSDERCLVAGHVGRCQVTQLAPLCFEGVIEFEIAPVGLSG